jgi:uncharacterized protein YaaQ
MRLVLAVVQGSDVEHLLRDFTELGVFATQIEGDAAVGRSELAAIMVGTGDDLLGDVLTLVHARARARSRRTEPLRPTGERAEFWVPGPTEQAAGGASVYVLPVQRFERIGYA